MKVLFLDIDGVLNSQRSAFGLGRMPHRIIYEDVPYFDQVAVGLIRNVCVETGAKIVLSSTWRIDKNWLELAYLLNLPIFDRTPSLDGHRGKEIADWLSRNKVEKYAIVDDDSDMLDEQMPFFVKTNFEEGLLFSHYKRLIELL